MLLFCFLYTMKDFSQNVCDKHVINTTRKKIIKTRVFFFFFFSFYFLKSFPRAFGKLCHARTWASLEHRPACLLTAASLSTPQPPHLCLQNRAARHLSIQQVLVTELPHPEKDRVCVLTLSTGSSLGMQHGPSTQAATPSLEGSRPSSETLQGPSSDRHVWLLNHQE